MSEQTTRVLRGSHVGEGDRSPVEWALPEFVDAVCPSAVSIVVELWSSEFDLTARSIIDSDGVELLDRLDTLALQMLAQAMSHDIDAWLEHVWKQASDDSDRVSARYNRVWQWTRARGVQPLGPTLDFQRRD